MKEDKNCIKHFQTLIIINNALTYGAYRFCHARVNVCSVINSIRNSGLRQSSFLLLPFLTHNGRENTDNYSIKYNNSE